ncbi:SAM-dependent methyltransferase [Prauserella oleivorans]|uniref:SAM-dependent methyltransferase n=1 Tax=Prauserella oleivorans TaxID=1478153 RepID=A0ABW5WKC4_9PSEU
MNADGVTSATGAAGLPAVIDTSKPSVARVYDCFLGGKDNYEVDRQVFAQIDSVAPQMKELARSGREWLIRATRFLAGPAGMDQFLDLGAGLPSAENTHQTAQRVNPDARVVYVDNDPVVAAHGRALLEENELTHLVMADLTKPDEVLGHPEIVQHLELDRPFVLMQCSTLHHVPDSEKPHDIMRRYVEALPSGSYVALIHFHDPQDGGEGTELARFVEDVFARGDMGSGYFRTREQIEAYFDGLEVLEPGLVQLNDWWPDGPALNPPTVADKVALAGVARKP